MLKKFLALARVSSREQEREGFSLDVQVDALTAYAERNGGSIVKMFRIAETASKKDERKAFRELLAYAREHAAELSGLLFYKVDRAARNLFDYVELERLEVDLGLLVIYVAQPTENSPAGRMQRRILSNMASFYTEQQSLDVQEGLARRVQSGLFISKAPYGYRNVRRDGRSLIEVEPENAAKVRRIYDLYCYHGHTLDSLVTKLEDEGLIFTPSVPRFVRSKLYYLLIDRAYIGEVKHKGQWYPGTHEPLIDRATWQRVQELMGQKVYRAHHMTYAGELITCGHCGRPITGEAKTKRTKAGEKVYVYYRCCGYTAADHPRVRVSEADLDQQVLAMFAKMRIEDEKVQDWFGKVLRARTQEDQRVDREKAAQIDRQLALVVNQQERLLNLRLLEEINASTFATKSTELRDREALLRLRAEAVSRGRHENADIVVKAFELSQSLQEKWVTADYAEKRRILEIVCLNCRLDDATLVPTIRKPFDVLIEGLLTKNSRGDRI